MSESDIKNCFGTVVIATLGVTTTKHRTSTSSQMYLATRIIQLLQFLHSSSADQAGEQNTRVNKNIIEYYITEQRKGKHSKTAK